MTADLAAERRAILEADSAWMAAVARRDLERTVSYWSEDATLMPPDMPAVKGRPAIRDFVAAAFGVPGFAISWATNELTVLADGGSAYQLATNQVTAPDATGTLRTTTGKAVVIWRKDPDGRWRAVVDIWNGISVQEKGRV